MKIRINTSAALLVVALLGLGGSIGDAAKNPATNYPALMAGSEIKGSHVKNLRGQDLGAIDEVLIEPDTGQVRFVILEVGGFLGLGATKVAVPWTAFQLTKEGDKPKWVLDADKDKLKNAPKIQGKGYERLYTSADAEPVFVYWKVTWIEPVTSRSPSSSSAASPSASTSP
ncbi:MAG TPA: PRC-barrel domain-containing protein [Chthoniobacterales bacterium]|nr:PRC-barrel domain-containing protein [Chthoniobacterales bacterium]